MSRRRSRHPSQLGCGLQVTSLSLSLSLSLFLSLSPLSPLSHIVTHLSFSSKKARLTHVDKDALYSMAVAKYEEAAAAKPEESEIYYNWGNSLYRFAVWRLDCQGGNQCSLSPHNPSSNLL